MLIYLSTILWLLHCIWHKVFFWSFQSSNQSILVRNLKYCSYWPVPGITYKNYKNFDINKSLHGYIIIKALIDAEMAIQLYFLSLHNYMTSRNLLQLYLFNTIPLRIFYEDYAVQFSTRQNPVLSGTKSHSNTTTTTQLVNNIFR